MDKKLDKIYDALKKVYKCTCKKSKTENVKANNAPATRGRSRSRVETNKSRALSVRRKSAANILKDAGVAASVANVSTFTGAVAKGMNQAAAINLVRTAKAARGEERKKATAAKKNAEKRASKKSKKVSSSSSSSSSNSSSNLSD
jgi:hypothetical protein